MTNEQFFDLCMYLATSAEGLKEEPKDYGPLRLLEVLERVALLGADECRDAFLQEVAEYVRAKHTLVMTDRAAFYEAIEELVVKFALEAKKRTTRKE